MPDISSIPPEVVAAFRKQGYTDEQIAQAQPVQQQQQNISIPSTIGRTLSAHAGGIIGGGVGSLGGAALGGEIGALGGPAAPVTVPIGAIIGGIVGGVGGGYAGQKGQQAVMSPEAYATQQQAAEEAAAANPKTALATDIVGSALASGGRPSLNALRAGKSIIGALRGGELSAAEKGVIGETALNTVLNPAINTGISYATTGQMPSGSDLAAQVAGGALFGKQAKWASKFTGMGVSEPAQEPIARTDVSQLPDVATAPKLDSHFTSKDESGNYNLTDKSIRGLFYKQVLKTIPDGADDVTKAYIRQYNAQMKATPVSDMRDYLHNQYMEQQNATVGNESYEDNSYSGGIAPETDVNSVGDGYTEQPITGPASQPTEQGPLFQQEILNRIIAKGATKAQAVQRIFPELKLSTDEANEALRQAGLMKELYDNQPKENYATGVREDEGQPSSTGQVTQGSESGSGSNVVETTPRSEESLQRPEGFTKENPPIVNPVTGQAKKVKTPVSDYNRYNELVKKLQKMGQDDVRNGKFNETWQELEALKNKYGGKVPAGNQEISVPQMLQTHIMSGKATTGSILHSLANTPNHDAQKLAKALLDAADTKSLGVRWNHDASLDVGDNERSHYDPSTDEVNIGTGSAGDARIVLEEVVHSLTTKKLPNFTKTGAEHLDELVNYVNKGSNESIKDLIKSYFHVARTLGVEKEVFGQEGIAGNPDKAYTGKLGAFKGNTGYALGNLDEFIAQAIKDPDFQRILDGIKNPDGDRSVWQTIVDAVRKLLGLDAKAGSMLDRVLRSSGELISQNREGGDASYGKRSTLPKFYHDERPMLTQTEKLMRDEKPFKGELPGHQVWSQLVNKFGEGSSEITLLKSSGLDKHLIGGGKFSAEDVANWLKEHGPKVEVHSYGMEGKVSEAKKEYDRMTHEWYEAQLSQKQKNELTNYIESRTGDHKEYGDEYLKAGGWSDKDIELARKYKEVGKQSVMQPSATPRATQYYSTVSAIPADQPMPEWTATKSGKNVQRVDVVVPSQYEHPKYVRADGRPVRTRADMEGGQMTGGKAELWQPDNLHENLPNTLGWAMIQYKTGPKGEKIAVITEAQSRWGQEVRNLKQQNEQRAKEGRPLISGEATKDHPLLRDYNRLILKAAIEQARKEGATHIMVSDAETAMMTEGHDLNAEMPRGNYATEESARQGLIALNRQRGVDTGYVVRQMPDGNYELAKAKGEIDQEPGMRLNYDPSVQIVDKEGNLLTDQRFPTEEDAHAWARSTVGGRMKPTEYNAVRGQLHQIAEELTGSKGEKVSLGEHKNALRNGDNDPEMRNPMARYRDNLIFRNPDGTPKTDVSGRLYPLADISKRLESGETMTLTGKRYAPPRDEQSPTPHELQLPPDKYLGKVGAITRAVLDKVRDIPLPSARKLADAMQLALNKRDELRGRWKNAIVQAGSGLTEGDKRRLMETFNRELATKSPQMQMLTNQAQRQFYLKAKALLKDSGEYRLNTGEPVLQAISKGGKTIYTPRDLRMDTTYFPGMANQKVMEIYRNGTDHEAMAKLDKEFDDWNQKHLGLTPEESKERIDTFHKSIAGTTAKSEISHQDYFNAHRKAMGSPLPPSFREQDPVRNLERYFDRAAIDASHYEYLEKNHDILRSLGQTKDAWGNKVASKDSERSLVNNRAVQAALHQWKGEPISPAEGNEHSLASLMTSAFISGPPLEIHKLVSNYVKVLSQAPDVRTLTNTIMNSIAGVRAGYIHAVENGVMKLTARSALDMMNGQASSAERMQALAKGIRNIATLGDMTTKLNAGLLQAASEVIIPSKISRANAGDVSAQKFMKNLDPTYIRGKEYSPEEMSKLASVSANYIHGTGDIRSMPGWMLNDSEFSGFFSLAHWSVAQTNNFMKEMYEPALRGDLKPLLTGMFGAAIGGYLIKELREKITGKHGTIPSLEELAASDKGISGNPGLVAYNMMSALMYAGFGGLLSQVSKWPMDKFYKNNSMGATFPLDEVASDLTETLGQVTTAAANDPHFNWVDAAKAVTLHILTSNMQLGRIAFNQGVNTGLITGTAAEKKMLSDKLGQLRRFDMVEGLPYEEIDAGSNPYMNLEQKKFHLEQDPQKALAMLPDLVNTIVEKYGSNPDVMMNKLQALKQNQYSTFPSMEKMPLSFMKYVGYLQRMEGPEAAQAELNDYLQHKVVNSVKSSVVP